MIYEYVLNRLKKAEVLGEDIYPVGVNIDDIYSANNDIAFTVYTFKSRTPVTDLDGELHHYRDEVNVDFISRLYDKTHAMYDAVEAVLAVSEVDTESSEWIHNVECISPEPDAFDPEYGLYRRTMLVRIDWSPV